jgi:hypothetical protein
MAGRDRWCHTFFLFSQVPQVINVASCIGRHHPKIFVPNVNKFRAERWLAMLGNSFLTPVRQFLGLVLW